MGIAKDRGKDQAPAFSDSQENANTAALQREGEGDQEYNLRIETEAAAAGMSVEDYKQQGKVDRGEAV